MLLRSVFVGSGANVSSPPKAFVLSHGTERPISTSVGFGLLAAPLKSGNVGAVEYYRSSFIFPPPALHASEAVPSCAGSG